MRYFAPAAQSLSRMVVPIESTGKLIKSFLRLKRKIYSSAKDVKNSGLGKISHKTSQKLPRHCYRT